MSDVTVQDEDEIDGVPVLYLSDGRRVVPLAELVECRLVKLRLAVENAALREKLDDLNRVALEDYLRQP